MIVPMSHLTVLCTEGDRAAALEKLRDIGVLHVTSESGSAPDGAGLAAAEASLSAARKALEIAKGAGAAPNAGADAIAPEDVLERQAVVESVGRECAALEKDVALYSHFGDFKPAEANALAGKGVPVTLFKAPAGSIPASRGGAVVKVLSEDKDEKAVFGVIVGGAPDAESAGDASGDAFEQVPMPPASLAEMRAALSRKREELAAAQSKLAESARAVDAIAAAVAERSAARDLAAAAATMGAEGGIAWITGFCPEDTLDKVRGTASKSGWGVAARKPRPDENPPTLLRPPRLFRPITSLFKILDIAPGYREVDLSVVFYGFFTIFFAMLVGDFGYGALMLAATLFFRRKFPRAPAAPFTLLTVFSLATCAWGVLSCNYFGQHPKALDFNVSRWLNDPSYTNIMQLCFLLGAIHLTVARLWSAAMLFPDSKFLAELGWAGVVWTMYCTSCAVVIPNFDFPKFMFVVAPVSILLIFLFMLKREELKTEGINLAILPLNIISCLGDIISYVRLFAVGLASVKVAENFNTMALEMNIPLWAKIPAVAVILLLGHGLNLVMGVLSILVHAVRLNTLEFSNHKGISWSGFAYAPFKR